MCPEQAAYLIGWCFFLVTEHGQSRQKVIILLGRLAIGTLEDEDGHTHTLTPTHAHTQIYDCGCF